MRISDWSSDVCSSDLCSASRWRACGPSARRRPRSTCSKARTSTISKSCASTIAATTRRCSAKRCTARSECCDGGEKPLPSDPEGAVEAGDGESGWFRDDVVRPRALDHHAGRPVGGTDRADRCNRRFHRRAGPVAGAVDRSEEHTSELQSLMRISYAVFCLKKKKNNNNINVIKIKQT